MAVNINVLSQWDDKGIRAAQNDLDKLKSKTQATSQKLAQGASLVGAGILAGAGAIGVGLFQIGTQFDDAFDRIRIGTGLTGPALEALQNDMKAVAGSVPATFSDASTAVTEFSKRLNLTGQPLQDLSKQVLELSRMTGTDLKTNIDAVADVMANFGVTSADQGGKLDVLFRASQRSGVAVADLATQMSSAGVVLRDLGLSFDQSAALLATLGKAGVDVSDVMPGLSRAMATAAKEGRDASTVFSETFNAIKNSPSDVEAAGVALEVFGAKAGPRLAALIREGKVSFEEMQAALANGDGIMKASADTNDFAEKLTTLKNRVFLAIEPIATRVFNAIGDAVERLAPKIEQLTHFMQENGETMKIVAGIIGGIVLVVLAAYTAQMIAAAAATVAATWPILAIVAAIALLVAGVIYAYNNFEWFKTAVDTAWDVIQKVIDFAWNNVIKPVFKAIAWYVENILIPGYKFLWEAVKTVFGAVGDIISFVWNKIISPVFDFIKEGVGTVIDVFGGIKDGLSEAFSTVFDIITWPFRTAFNFISDAWNNTVGKLSFGVPDWVPFIGGKSFKMPTLPTFAKGGMFNTSLDGGQGLAVLHDNEMILNPQQQAALFGGRGLGGGDTVNVVINTVAGDPVAIERIVVDAIGRANKRGATALVP